MPVDADNICANGDCAVNAPAWLVLITTRASRLFHGVKCDSVDPLEQPYKLLHHCGADNVRITLAFGMFTGCVPGTVC